MRNETQRKAEGELRPDALLFRYRLDARDRIERVDDAWLEFARSNGAAGLDRSSVVGQPIGKFVAGVETRHLFDLVFSAVREKRKPLELPFRCNSPNCRRHMLLTISPLPADAPDASARMLREEPRSPVALLDTEVARSEELLTICSWCKRVRMSSGDWVEVETAIGRLDLFGCDRLPQLSHGVCRPSEAAVETEFGG